MASGKTVWETFPNYPTFQCIHRSQMKGNQALSTIVLNFIVQRQRYCYNIQKGLVYKWALSDCPELFQDIASCIT